MEQLATLIPLILIIGVFYFFIIRPQSKQQRELQQMREAMKEGDEVVTIGGFYGVIYAIDEQNVVLELLPDFHKVMVVKNAISRVISPEESLITDEPEEVIDETEEIVDEPETNETESENTDNGEKDEAR